MLNSDKSILGHAFSIKEFASYGLDGSSTHKHAHKADRSMIHYIMDHAINEESRFWIWVVLYNLTHLVTYVAFVRHIRLVYTHVLIS